MQYNLKKKKEAVFNYQPQPTPKSHNFKRIKKMTKFSLIRTDFFLYRIYYNLSRFLIVFITTLKLCFIVSHKYNTYIYFFRVFGLTLATLGRLGLVLGVHQ